MKNLILVVLFAVICFSCDQSAIDKIDVRKIDAAKENKITPLIIDQVDMPSDAQMNFDLDEWDFCEINQGDVVEHSFEFTNTGKDPLIISNAKGSCGCTVPEWPRAPIPPGEKGVIDVKFDSKGKKGQQNKRITLTTNVVPSQQVLIVKGMVNVNKE